MLTPDEIKGRQFLVSLRGYDREEVQAFLRQIAEQVGQLQRTVSQLRAEAKVHAEAMQGTAVPEPARTAAESALPDEEGEDMLAEIGKETQRILEAAKEAAARIRRRARQDADAQLQEARNQSAKVIADGERRREETDKVVSELEQSRERLSGDLRKVGRTIEQTLRDLLPTEQARSVREALSSEATAERDGHVDEDGDPRSDAAESVRSPDEVGAPPPDASEEPAAGGDAAPAAAAEASPAEEGARVRVISPPLDEPDESSPGLRASDESVVPSLGTLGQPLIDPHERRSAALTALHPKVVRRLRRGMADLHNVTLDRLRRSRTAEIGSLVHASEDFAPLWKLAGDYLEQGFANGCAAAADLAGRELPTPRPAAQLREDFLADSAVRVSGPLAATLRIGASEDEDSMALGERISAVFAELRSATSEELATTHLMRAYELGMLEAWREGEITHRQWISGREPRCPEARCRHNDQAGAVAVSEPFPSGHETPPVHVGCTCTTVPISDR